MHASTMVLVITSPLNVGLNYLFVRTANIGLLGAPIAVSISCESKHAVRARTS